MLRSLLAIALFLLFSSCNKSRIKGGDKIEMYLLATHQAVLGKCQVDSSLSTLQEIPFITNDEILLYSRATFEYRLKPSAVAKIKKLTGRTPFAITVDRKVIFYGYYMPIFMSSGCGESITMDLGFDQFENNIYMKAGYPGLPAAQSFNDQRNNKKLLATFARQGKLK